MMKLSCSGLYSLPFGCAGDQPVLDNHSVVTCWVSLVKGVLLLNNSAIIIQS